MPDKKLTDSEIIKGLNHCVNDDSCNCAACPFFELEDAGYPPEVSCEYKAMELALDLINRQKAEIERLKDLSECYFTSCQQIAKSNHEIKSEAYKEFYAELHTEILEARNSNFKAKEERCAKFKEYGIPIDAEDSFLMYCDGKIHALDGIDYFAYETLNKMVGEQNV